MNEVDDAIDLLDQKIAEYEEKIEALNEQREKLIRAKELARAVLNEPILEGKSDDSTPYLKPGDPGWIGNDVSIGDAVERVLRAEGTVLHVTWIHDRLIKAGKRVEIPSIVSTLVRDWNGKDRFDKQGRNVYGLKEWTRAKEREATE
jgi:hypothetical protein